MTFGEVTATAMQCRRHIPAHLVEDFDRLTYEAIRASVIPEVEEILDTRPLAEIIALHGYSRDVSA